MLLIPVTCSSVKYSNFCVKSSYIFTDVLSPPGGSPHSCDGGLRRGVVFFNSFFFSFLFFVLLHFFVFTVVFVFLSYIFPSYKPLKT